MLTRIGQFLQKSTAISAEAFILFLLLFFVPFRAWAAPFIGSPPLPAHESAWILLDGEDPAVGTTATIDAAERFATSVLQLQPGKSVFRFAPKTHDLASVGKSFEKGGKIGKELEHLKPAVVVLLIEGKALPSGPGYGSDELTHQWVTQRIQDVTAVCPSALVLVIVEPCSRGMREKVFAANKKREVPLYLMLDAVDRGRISAAPTSSLFGALEHADPATASLKGALAKVFTEPPDAPVGIVGTMFLTGLLGAAQDSDGNGYDVLEIASWMFSKYPLVVDALDPAHTRYGEFLAATVWGGKEADASIAPAYPLKRRRYTIGTCVAAASLLPALPNESDAHRAERTKADLDDLAKTLATSARDAFPNIHDALVIDAFDPSKLPPPFPPPKFPPSGLAACASTGVRNNYDVWVDLFHLRDGQYIFQVSRVRTHEVLKTTSDKLPDRAHTSEALFDAGKEIMKPIAIYKPTQETDIVAAVTTTPPPAKGASSLKFDEANDLFKKGKSLYESRNFDGALAFFQRSDETYSSTEALLGKAMSEEQLGNLDDAQRDLQLIQRRLPPNHEQSILARKYATALEARIRSRGEQDSVRDRSFWSQHRASVISGGTAVALGVAGIGLGVRSYTHYNDLFTQCGGSAYGCGDSDKASVQTESRATTALFATAGAVAATTIILFIVENSMNRSKASPRTRVTPGRVPSSQ
jgi:tetratricopeptide (TPR) repeat protein